MKMTDEQKNNTYLLANQNDTQQPEPALNGSQTNWCFRPQEITYFSGHILTEFFCSCSGLGISYKW